MVEGRELDKENGRGWINGRTRVWKVESQLADTR